jgi:predicted HTH domain antitoxin
MNIVVPDNAFCSPPPAREAVMTEVAITLMRLYWISPANAAGMIGMEERELLQLLTDRRIVTRYNADEVHRAMEEMRKTLW